MKMLPVGIQLFPFDLRDEGLESVLTVCREELGATLLLPALNYIVQRQPYPRGVLPRNGRHAVYHTDGGSYFLPREELYANTTVRPVPTEEDEILDTDWYGDLVDAAADSGLEVVPWVSLLNGRHAARSTGAAVVDINGDPVDGWLCPNNPATVAFMRGFLNDIVTGRPAKALFIDRIRYPEWGGRGRGIDGVLTCFCDHCRARAKESFIDLEKVRSALPGELQEIGGIIGAMSGARVPLNGIDWMKLLSRYRAVLDYLSFRCASITRLIVAAKDEIDRHGQTALWLDLWPPSYAWILGQDFYELSRYCSAIKTFTYHKLGGGFDMSLLFREFAANGSSGHDGMWRTFGSVFRFEAPPDFEDFRARGFAPRFIYDETWRTKCELHPASQAKVFAGIQLWDVSAAEVRTSVKAALQAKPDGIIFYNYGRAEIEAMNAARDTIARSPEGEKGAEPWKSSG